MVRNAAYEHAIRKDVDPRVEDPWDLSKVDAKTLWPVIPKRSAPPAAQCWFPAVRILLKRLFLVAEHV